MKLLAITIGLMEIGLLTWGIIEFWGTPWSVAGLVYAFMILNYTAYKMGMEKK